MYTYILCYIICAPREKRDDIIIYYTKFTKSRRSLYYPLFTRYYNTQGDQGATCGSGSSIIPPARFFLGSPTMIIIIIMHFKNAAVCRRSHSISLPPSFLFSLQHSPPRQQLLRSASSQEYVHTCII